MRPLLSFLSNSFYPTSKQLTLLRTFFQMMKTVTLQQDNRRVLKRDYHTATILSSRYFSGNCSDLAKGEFGGEKSQALLEGIEALSHPGAKEAGQSHAGRRAFRAARAPT